MRKKYKSKIIKFKEKIINEEAFAKRLYELRNQKNISARDMSYSLNLNPNYINMIENGKAFPSFPAFFNICSFLDISPKDFFDYEIKNVNKFNQLISEIKTLSDVDLNSIENIVHSLSIK